MFIPGKVLIVHVVRFENLVLKSLLLNCSFMLSSMCLFLCCTFSLILEIKSDWQLEIALNSTTLVLTTEGIINFNVYFRAVESSITRINGPGSSEFIESFCERSFGLVPLVVRPKSNFWPSWKLKFESESKNAINIVKEIEYSHNFVWKSFWGAEKMRVILLESTNTSKTWEGTWDLVSVKNAEICESDWQISERSYLVIEHKTVTRTVHRLHTEALPLDLPHEDVLFVCSVMSWRLPQFEIKNVWWQYFLVSSDAVLLPDELNEFVVNFSAVWVEKGTSGWQLVIVKKFLSAANSSVIAFFCLFLKMDIFVKLLLAREGNTVHTLQVVVQRIAKPVGRWVFHYFEGFNDLGARNVWTSAKIDQIAALVSSDLAVFWDLCSN